MTRAFDHLVLAVNDLDSTAAAYQRMGFTLTPKAQHPFGTGNRLVQLQGVFLELLAVTIPDDVPNATPGEFSLGAYNRDFLTRREGLSMMVLQTEDEAADQQQFTDAGLQTYAPFEFSRQAKLPDGSEATVGFSLTFATISEMPEAVAFTCRQWRPDLFWKPEYQDHSNGAVSVAEVIMVADEVGIAAPLLKGLDVDKVRVLTAAEFQAQYPGVRPPEGPGRGRFAGYRITVTDLCRTRSVFNEAGLLYSRGEEMLWIGPMEGFGAVIEFSE